MFCEHHRVREFADRDIVKAVVRVEKCFIQFDVGEVAFHRVEQCLEVVANVLWAGLLVVSYDDCFLG